MGHGGSCFDLCHQVLPMFSSKSFIVSGLTVRSLTYFEFLFVYGIMKCFNFIFFTCSCPVFPAPLLEETVFSPLFSIAFFLIEKIDHRCMSLSLNFLSYCNDLYFGSGAVSLTVVL